MLVYVSGRVALHKWKGQDDSERASLQLTADKVVFLSKDKDYSEEHHPEDESSEDIPF